MPTIPRVEGPSVAASPLPDAYQRAPQALGQAGQVQAQQIGLAGKALAAAADQYQRVQDEQDQVRVDDAINQLKQRRDDLTFNRESGYVAQRGEAALKRESGMPLADEYTGQLEKTVAALGNSLGSERQKRLFGLKANDITTGFRGQVLSHETQQADAYALSVREGKIAVGQDEAGRFWNDPAHIDQALQDIEGAVTEIGAKMGGKAADWVKARTLVETSKAVTSAVSAALAVDNYPAAKALLSLYEGRMTPDDRSKMVDRTTMLIEREVAARKAEAERKARLAEIEANRRERAAGQAWAILSGRAMGGVATDRAADRELFQAIAGTPYAKEYERLAAEIPKRQAAAMLPLTVQQQQIDELIGRRNTGGTSETLEADIKFRKDILASATRAYDESPLRATQQYGIQNIVRIDTSSLPALIETIGPRVQQADVARTVTGKPAPPLLPEEVPALQRHLAALPPDQFGAAVASMAGKVPAGQMAALAKQLDAHDRPLALAMAAGTDMTTQGRATAELIRRGAQFAKDKSVKEDQGAELGLRAQIAKEVGDAVPPAARQDVIDAARLVYMGKQGEGNTISIGGAVRLAIGGDLVEHNGRRLPVPPGVNLADRLQSYPRAAIDAQAPDGFVYLPGGRPMGVPEFLSALPAAQLEPDGRGRFLVRSGGSLVMNQNRQPIVVLTR